MKDKDNLISMSRVGNSLDNYPIEHHFNFLKRECLWKLASSTSIKEILEELDKYYD
jgi:hypothetical protein